MDTVGVAIGLVFGLVLGLSYRISSATTTDNTNVQSTVQPTSQPTQIPTPTQPVATPTPTYTPKWTTVQTMTGNGIKKTAVFTVPNDWKIVWSCNPNSFYGGQYNMQVYVYGFDSSPPDVAVNTICKAGNTSDSTEEYQSGQCIC